MKRGHGEMYTTLGRDGSGSSRSELSFFFCHVLMTFFLFSDLKNVSYVHNHLLLLP